MFIHHSNTFEVLDYLAEAIIGREIIPLVGCEASGKSRLLHHLVEDYWKQERGLQHKIPRVVYAEISPQPGKSGGRYSTPIAVDTFTKITFGLAQISQQYDSEMMYLSKMWYRNPEPQYTDRQFSSLLTFVKDEVQRLDVSALLIDNAEFLDGYTLESLMDVRRLRNHQLGLIFSARIEKPGIINEHLEELINVVISQKHKEDCESALELATLTAEETWGPVLKGFLKQLNASFDPSLSKQEITLMRSMFWSETRGDWKVIDVRRRRFDKLLGPKTGQRRFLAREIFEKVMGKTLPLPPSSSDSQEQNDLPF